MKKVAILLLAGFSLIALGRTPSATAAEEKKDPNDLKAAYKGGFQFTTASKKFSLRLFSAVQFRYTYIKYDDKIKGNDHDYSNFYMRRARLWWDGYAYNPNLTYYFHLQLEPQGAVNLHDAWVNYKVTDLFQVGLGRNKVFYGLEQLHSGFGLNFIERSILYGETDIDAGGGGAKFPGGNGSFGLSSYNANTGFATGGMNLYRSQGLAITGLKGSATEPTFEYQVGVWNGRDNRGRSNEDSKMLYTARVGYHPFGRINWLFCGDPDFTEHFKVAFWAATFTDTKLRKLDAAAASVTPYEAVNSGYSLAAMAVYKGFSADLEWSNESFDMRRHLPGVWKFDREGWRAAFGYFIVPTRVEIVGRYAEIQRLKDPTGDAVKNSGLGFAKVWNGTAYVDGMEKKMTEVTAGLNFYLGAHKHQHKLFFDVSLLGRSFTSYQNYTPKDQEDKRFRSMFQMKF